MSTYTIIIAWLVSSMSLWARPGASPNSRVVIEQCDETCQKTPTCEGGGIACRPPIKWGQNWTRQETREEGEMRYLELAESIVRVAYDPEEKPLFAGPTGRARTALWMAATAWGESGLRKDVGEGIGPKARGDNGGSYCHMQINLPGKSSFEGLTGADMLVSYDNCFRAGLHKLRIHTCKNTKTEVGRWSGYRGVCSDKDWLTKMRLDAMARAIIKSPVPAKDADVEVPPAKFETPAEPEAHANANP